MNLLYNPRLLRVDLTDRRCTVEYFDRTPLRLYVGGTGLAARILYDEVSPGVAWDDPENRLILATGPLNGTTVPGAGTFAVVTKGPLTNGATSSQANGYFGAYLRLCGFDVVIVQGRATDWLYLYIRDGVAELRGASGLVGKDTVECETFLKEQLAFTPGHASAYSIGPAGEHLVKFAAIVGDHGHVVAHNGVGAVMGSKLLKSVVAHPSSRALPLSRRQKQALAAQGSAARSTMKTHPLYGQLYEWGTSLLVTNNAYTGALPVKNLTTNVFPAAEVFSGEYYRSRFTLKRNPCWSCPTRHLHLVTVSEGPCAGYEGEEPEYEGWAAFGPLIGQTDPGTALMLNDITDRLGLDCNETGWLIAFVMECYEKGILTGEDTDGLSMNWGNAAAVRTLLHKISRREGFGDVLAEGVMRSAKRLGRGAEDTAVFLEKGHAPRGHDHRVRWGEILDAAASGTGTIETGPVRVREQFGPTVIAETYARAKVLPFVDSLVLCSFTAMSMAEPEVPAHLIEMLNGATGWDFCQEEAARTGQRIANVLRAFNVRHGILPTVEMPSARYRSAPVDGPAAGKTIKPHWENMLATYYGQMGWDQTSGKPLPKTLIDLQLHDVARDLWPGI